MLTPVTLPPGRARLAMNLASTRSSAIATIGIELVACCAARVAGSPAVTMTARLRDQRFGELGQPLGVALGKPELEANIAAVDLSERGQGGAELRRHRLDGVRRVDAQHCDQRQPSGPAPAPEPRRTAPTRAQLRYASFDDLVGAGEDRWRDREAEHLARS